MKVCCKDFKELIDHIDDYPSLIFQLNITDGDKITFDLAFTDKTVYGQSWHYIKYCPFCSKEVLD